jgi:hypothetical protein
MPMRHLPSISSPSPSPLSRPRLWRLAATFAFVAAALGACTPYEAPASATLDGMVDGLLDSRQAGLTVRFDRPVQWDTLRLEIVPFQVDTNGDMADETPAATEEDALTPILYYDGPTDSRGGTFTASDDGLSLTIMPRAHLPVGPKLAVLLYAGLTTKDGVQLTYRRRIPFAYKFECTGTRGAGALPSGSFFFLLNVEKPTATQVKLFARIRIDETTGRFSGVFTNAARKRDPNRCPTPCASTDACQLHPAPLCVPPSLRAGSAEEWEDFLPNALPPSGFQLNIQGCAEALDDGSVAFATVPTELAIEQPPVRVQGLVVSSAFRQAGDVWAATGGITGDNVIFGNTGLGAGQGTVLATTVAATVDLPGLPALETLPKP